MVLDASAIIAMLGDEAEGNRFAAALEGAATRSVSPVAVWETVVGLARVYPLSIAEARRKVAEFLATAEVEMLVIGPNSTWRLTPTTSSARAAIPPASTSATASPTQRQWLATPRFSAQARRFLVDRCSAGARRDGGLTLAYESIFSAAMNASCGMSTLPNWRIFFLPAFCFSRSLRLRVASPP